MKYIILKDKILNCYIVWEIYTNYKIDIYHGKTKKGCKEWLKSHEV